MAPSNASTRSEIEAPADPVKSPSVTEGKAEAARTSAWAAPAELLSGWLAN
jgi:hypothetical protein